ncbi:MAG: precorrin-6y C5,15-methyltransferase (decarboxylating) subunit CbiE [Rhodospirillales bacterium]|jgi:precorrin-6Y C5,15-methyltransferase (decarboxylating)|nr:precorrin-6y C5,15-methyltransferase (decarboxylating) subunit CbiE [Rhodospirillales bacterium]
MTPWLTVVGIGEDGLQGLGLRARRLVEGAEVLVGGARHLAKIPPGRAERVKWEAPLAATIARLQRLRGRRVTVLASGDPLHYGIAARLARHFGAGEMTVVPAPGAFSLAAARMGWPIADTELVTVHGRPIENVLLRLFPGARLLILSRDGETPSRLAELLVRHGYGASAMTVHERMAGADEARVDGRAEGFRDHHFADLNTIALEARAESSARPLSRVPGLPDDAFEHDGQITKREVRAATLAALAPLPGEVLWDVGAGSGAVAIEWMRAQPRTMAFAVERNADRCAAIARNAAQLGVPRFVVVAGEAPAAFTEIAREPQAVFVGGGASNAGLIEACWEALTDGGRLVANAVTLEAEQAVLAFHARHGGSLVRLAVSRAEPLGGYTAWRAAVPVTQYAVLKG